MMGDDTRRSSEGGTAPGCLWESQAKDNIELWGNQPPQALVLAMAEELAEIADELLDPENLSSGDTEGQLLLQQVRATGYECREYLETNCEDEDGNPLPRDEWPDLTTVSDPTRALWETEDLAPLVFQLYWALNSEDQTNAE